jgi:putative transposase
LAEDRDLLKTIVEETLQQVLEAEMDEVLQAGKSERTAGRLGYGAGYHNRMLVTRVGHIEWRVPQDRQGRFRTEVFERYQRSEKALLAAMLEMYVQGVSRRKVKTITEELCGHEFSSSTISRIVQKLDEELERFARRRWEERYPYLILDARYEKVREDGAVRSQAVRIAIGSNWEGRSWSATMMRACGVRFKKHCRRPCGNAAMFTSCAMRSTICHAKQTTIACRSCAGSRIVATPKKRARTCRLGC